METKTGGWVGWVVVIQGRDGRRELQRRGWLDRESVLPTIFN